MATSAGRNQCRLLAGFSRMDAPPRSAQAWLSVSTRGSLWGAPRTEEASGLAIIKLPRNLPCTALGATIHGRPPAVERAMTLAGQGATDRLLSICQATAIQPHPQNTKALVSGAVGPDIRSAITGLSATGDSGSDPREGVASRSSGLGFLATVVGAMAVGTADSVLGVYDHAAPVDFWATFALFALPSLPQLTAGCRHAWLARLSCHSLACPTGTWRDGLRAPQAGPLEIL